MFLFTMMMAAACKGFLLCSVLFIAVTEGKEFTVTCVHSEECVLPCQFKSDGKGARVMWYKKKAVVSCTRYGNTSFVVGHNSPADKYKGRTDLYAHEVLGGNATLLLRNVTPHDQGKYFCITMTAPRTDESGVISLVVKAPVRDVDIELSGDVLTCRAGGIYPAPKLTWSIDPPTDARWLQNRTNTQEDPLGFYNIQSSLILKRGNATNQTFICLVSSDINERKVILKPEASVMASPGSDQLIHCSFPDGGLKNFNLTWRFKRSDPILSINVTEQSSLVKVWDRWKLHVSNGLSASSGLQLHNLKPEHQGTYTCEVSTPNQTYVTQIDVTLSAASISGSSHSDTSIPCMDSNDPLTSFNLTWRYNHTEIILTQTNGVVHYEDQKQWEKHVKEISSSGSLILKDLSEKQEGIFTCELRNAEGTFVSNTLVKINTSQDPGKGTLGSGDIAGIVIGVLAGLVIIGLVIYCKKKLTDSVI